MQHLLGLKFYWVNHLVHSQIKIWRNIMKNKYISITTGIIVVIVLLFWIRSCKVTNDSSELHYSYNVADDEHGHNKDQNDVEDHGVISLSQDELDEFEITTDIAGSGFIEIHRDLAGEIVVDPKRLAHIGPRFPGIVKEVNKQLGDRVIKDEVVAIIESNESLSHYEVRSLIDGTIVEMHLTRGEMVSDSDHKFVVADLSEVWVNLSVYQKDLPFIKLGQTAEISLGQGDKLVNGKISYISPIVDEHTRTATARVILKNPGELLKPGLFVSAKIIVDKIKSLVVVPKTALQNVGDNVSIFIKTDEGFKPVYVQLGKTNDKNVEIVRGLVVGQEYVSSGGFTLKAELAKDSFGGDDDH
jgi:cobalt-zinc-cadmium efflux system membrane fusion protein